MPTHENFARRAAAAASVCVALALPASILFGRGALAVSLSLAMLTLVVAVAAGLRWPIPAHALRLPLALAVVVTLAWVPSVLHSLSPAASAVALGRSLAMVAGGVVLTTFLARDESMLTARAFILGLLVAEAVACVTLYLWPSLLAFRSPGPPVPHLLFKASASAIACAMPLLLYAGWRLGGRWRLAVAACILLGVAVMAGTGSKSALAGVLAACALSSIIAVSRSAKPAVLALWLAVPAVLGLGAVSAIKPLPPPLSIGGYHLFAPPWLIDMHRQVIWQFTLERFAEQPWLGWGPNVINTAPGAGEVIPELNAEYIPSHPHNWVVETLAETGVVGCTTLVLVVLGVAVAAARAYRRNGEVLWLAWMALWLTYWSAGAFNFSMWNTSWQSSGIVLAALLLSHMRPQRPA